MEERRPRQHRQAKPNAWKTHATNVTVSVVQNNKHCKKHAEFRHWPSGVKHMSSVGCLWLEPRNNVSRNEDATFMRPKNTTQRSCKTCQGMGLTVTSARDTGGTCTLVGHCLRAITCGIGLSHKARSKKLKIDTQEKDDKDRRPKRPHEARHETTRQRSLHPPISSLPPSRYQTTPPAHTTHTPLCSMNRSVP